ncbi:MAG: DUF357 domain-containing protein [Methanomicrobia archaeon]|nr:DUF357 domain-containing protein [Methanomicrobia archaeon]
MKEITDEKLEKYIEIAEKALKKVKIIVPESSHLEMVAKDFLDMAERYYKDALYYREKGDYVTAFAALNYLHGYLDAGARLGIFEVNDSDLFAF